MTPDHAGATAGRGLGARFRRVFAAASIANLGDGIGAVAYPWLASAVTRSPVLIALVAVVQRLPWLLFSLPAGVITDRVDRRRAMVAMDALRAAVTLAVAVAVAWRTADLPAPDAVDTVVATDTVLYALLLLATLLLGSAEVLRDNAAQTILPAVVPADRLERANGRLWAAEATTNTFVGPPLGSVLLLVAFAVPFAVHASTFAVAAVIMATLSGTFRATPSPTLDLADHDGTAGTAAPRTWRRDLADGVRWLWSHELLRRMAIILGLTNAAMMMTGATLVLFAQEILGAGPFVFAVIGFGGAAGSILGGMLAPRWSARFGAGACLAAAMGGSAIVSAAIGLSSHWAIVLVLFGVTAVLGILWNVITVSLRQAIIPSHLLGRVNSVYRFFAWGMLPIGAAVGGLLVAGVERTADRELALRSPWFASAVIHVALFVVVRRHLTTERIEAARVSATGDATG